MASQSAILQSKNFNISRKSSGASGPWTQIKKASRARARKPAENMLISKNEMTLDCFIYRSSSFFTNVDHPQSRVISARSWYLTSFCVPRFLQIGLDSTLVWTCPGKQFVLCLLQFLLLSVYIIMQVMLNFKMEYCIKFIVLILYVM